MKKNYLILSMILLMSAFFASCDFLNVDDYFEDTFKEDSIFSSQWNIERYFNGAASELPVDGMLWNAANSQASSVPGVTGSDEAVSCGTIYGIVPISFPGTELTTNAISASAMSGWYWDFNIWPKSYKAIRKVNTILPHINDVPDMNSFDKAEFRARCRFLRAYAYYLILEQNGPIILLGDEVVNNNESPEYYARTRSTYDECVDYICSEFEAAAPDLKTEFTLSDMYIPTEGAALALAARIRLQAASPLYNGGSAARRFFGNFTRSTDGVNYISQTYDESKWAVAAAAAKKVIDLGRYELHTVAEDEDYPVTLPNNVPSDPFPNGAGGIDPYRSYSEMFNGETAVNSNPEFIWVSSADVTTHLGYIFPLDFGGSSCICVPQRIIDQYYMADGRDINNSSTEYPYEATPYDKSCVTQSDQILSKHYRVSAGTYKAYANREPRFYVNIGYPNAFWEMSTSTSSGKYNQNINYYNGANAGKNKSSNNIYNITGYVGRKYVHPMDALSGSNARTVSKTYPIIRYAEILLAYVEALNNLTQSYEIDNQTYSRNTEEMKKYFNMVRYRAGLPGVSDSELSSADDFNTIIQRERLIELFWEGQRYYDVRRWGIIEELENETLTGLNVNQQEWEGFYQPTVIQYSTIRERVFKAKQILLPIHLDEIRKVSGLDQNPGWED